jgi:hypothetical protein
VRRSNHDAHEPRGVATNPDLRFIDYFFLRCMFSAGACCLAGAKKAPLEQQLRRGLFDEPN